MSSTNKIPIIPIRTQILHAWNTEKERDKLLKNLGGINVDGSPNVNRLNQIKEAVESILKAKQDDEGNS